MEQHKQQSAAEIHGLQSSKRWKLEFDEDRPFTDRLFLDTLPEQKNRLKPSAAFLRYEQSAQLGYRGKCLENFLANASSKFPAGLPQERAWVDDRKESEEKSTWSPELLDSVQLRHKLRQQWHGKPFRNDIGRLLIHVLGITPEFAIALIDTVSQNGVGALRAALCGHIARDAALRVSIKTIGFTSYHLEFHLPYFTLRERTSRSESRNVEDTIQHELGWRDVTYLKQALGARESGTRFAIYEAHVSIVISGSDRTKYTGYAFTNPGSIVHHFDEENGDSDLDGDEEEGYDDDDDEEEEIKPPEDQFTTDGRQRLFYADAPFRDPRIVFLNAIQVRVELALEECDNLARTIESHIETGMHRNIPLPLNYAIDYYEHASGWLEQVTELLLQLQKGFSFAQDLWTQFEASHGDIAYFSDLIDPAATIAINTIRDAFKNLANLEKRLSQLEKSCKERTSGLGIRMGLRDNELNRENIRLTSQALELTTTTIRLNRKTTEIAHDSLKTAESTSRITRLSIFFVIATSPLIIALQYFTSERNLFAFERNSRNFFASIGILMLLLLLLAFLFSGLETYLVAGFWKSYEKMSGRKRKPKVDICDDCD